MFAFLCSVRRLPLVLKFFQKYEKDMKRGYNNK
jgi:hypothetical protein